MVRLKGGMVTEVDAFIEGFNSTMVRLKVGNCKFNAILVVEFQFHNGSIKSSTQDSNDYALRKSVSIPQWFD